ncbi:glutamate--tRNA ligase [Defluviitalea phaphyphila]|uniref:glutamate--tRNA ligase n=1 Tax=Defluviitalea phaphyphila TaxID=1473580 RepID=UPI000730BB23|nr:glutamate--tRNA ligase [Defluviitalea phaphyphila]
MNKIEKVRFAPSPTGYLHIGGARTALFNYLYAKKTGGKFLVRIEDTDLARSSKESEEVIIKDLHWLGINWDEGIEVGGENGPYRSMERINLYDKFIKKLLDEGKAYYCYCSEEEIEEQRKIQRAKNEVPKYTGKCRNLTQEQIEEYKKQGRKPVIRFKVPEGKKIVVHDQIRGDVEFDSDGIGDFIIVKSDGIPVYNFAVVVDDYLMGITTVIRGEEHLSNTPRQILIYEALGFEVPKFAHVSLILGEDRSKMSKRHGSTHVDQYRNKGYLPEAIVNFLALLGWSPEGEEEIFSLSELEKMFSIDRVTKNPAVFDINKLNYINGKYIREADISRLTDLAIPFIVKAGFITEEEAVKKRPLIERMVNATREKFDYLEQITEHVKVFFEEEIEPENEEAQAMLKLEHVKDMLLLLKEKVNSVDELSSKEVKNILKSIQKETGIKGKNLFMPIRVALSGQCHGADIYEVISILGKDKVINRINYTIENLL